MSTIVTGMRRRTDQRLQTIYSDLASNNFNQLFANLEVARRTSLRAVSEPVVRAAFNQPDGEAGTVESLYERIRARLLAEPERYSWRFIQVAALLTRR